MMGGREDIMQTVITVSADISENARQAAVNQAYAQGFTSVQVFQTRQVGPREYEVTLMVSK